MMRRSLSWIGAWFSLCMMPSVVATFLIDEKTSYEPYNEFLQSPRSNGPDITLSISPSCATCQELRNFFKNSRFEPSLSFLSDFSNCDFSLCETNNEIFDTAERKLNEEPLQSHHEGNAFTLAPTPSPTMVETPKITCSPTSAPTVLTTVEPTEAPSFPVTIAPTSTVQPTLAPILSVQPTLAPTLSVQPTLAPISSVQPTLAPTLSVQPTVAPTLSVQPTVAPTLSVQPTVAPTLSVEPTVAPTLSVEPTVAPTLSVQPTLAPTFTVQPTLGPSMIFSSLMPTLAPSAISKPILPTSAPSSSSDNVTSAPNNVDTSPPSQAPIQLETFYSLIMTTSFIGQSEKTFGQEEEDVFFDAVMAVTGTEDSSVSKALKYPKRYLLSESLYTFSRRIQDTDETFDYDYEISNITSADSAFLMAKQLIDASENDELLDLIVASGNIRFTATKLSTSMKSIAAIEASSPSTSKESPLKLEYIIAIAAVGGVLIIFFVALIWFKFFKKKQKKVDLFEENSQELERAPSVRSGNAKSMSSDGVESGNQNGAYIRHLNELSKDSNKKVSEKDFNRLERPTEIYARNVDDMQYAMAVDADRDDYRMVVPPGVSEYLKNRDKVSDNEGNNSSSSASALLKESGNKDSSSCFFPPELGDIPRSNRHYEQPTASARSNIDRSRIEMIPANRSEPPTVSRASYDHNRHMLANRSEAEYNRSEPPTVSRTGYDHNRLMPTNRSEAEYNRSEPTTVNRTGYDHNRLMPVNRSENDFSRQGSSSANRAGAGFNQLEHPSYSNFPPDMYQARVQGHAYDPAKLAWPDDRLIPRSDKVIREEEKPTINYDDLRITLAAASGNDLTTTNHRMMANEMMKKSSVVFSSNSSIEKYDQDTMHWQEDNAVVRRKGKSTVQIQGLDGRSVGPYAGQQLEYQPRGREKIPPPSQPTYQLPMPGGQAGSNMPYFVMQPGFGDESYTRHPKNWPDYSGGQTAVVNAPLPGRQSTYGASNGNSLSGEAATMIRKMCTLSNKLSSHFHSCAHTNANSRAIAFWARDISMALDGAAVQAVVAPSSVSALRMDTLDAAFDALSELAELAREHKKTNSLAPFALSTMATDLVGSIAYDLYSAFSKTVLISSSDLNMFVAPQLQVIGLGGLQQRTRGSRYR